jgi:hypothetical protein
MAEFHLLLCAQGAPLQLMALNLAAETHVLSLSLNSWHWTAWMLLFHVHLLCPKQQLVVKATEFSIVVLGLLRYDLGSLWMTGGLKNLIHQHHSKHQHYSKQVAGGLFVCSLMYP